MVNSGCESHFATLDWRAAKHGGIMPISLEINFQVVSYNRFLKSSKKAKKNLCSKTFWKRFHFLENQFHLERYKKNKERELELELKLLHQCKTHREPMTETSIYILENFTLEFL